MSRMRSSAMSSSSTTSTRGDTATNAGWISVIADSSAAAPAGCSVTFTAANSQLQGGTRFAQLRAQAEGVHARVDARHQFGFAHSLGEVVVDARAVAAFEVEVVLARGQHDHVG